MQDDRSDFTQSRPEDISPHVQWTPVLLSEALPRCLGRRDKIGDVKLVVIEPRRLQLGVDHHILLWGVGFGVCNTQGRATRLGIVWKNDTPTG